MQLSVSQIQQAILHPDRDVRDAAVFYYSASAEQTPDVLHQILAAIEQYGWRDAVSLDVLPDELPLDDDSITGLLAQLNRDDISNDAAGRDFYTTIALLLCQGAPDRLASRLDEIERAKHLPDAIRTFLSQRVAAREKSSQQGWETLEAFCQQHRDLQDAEDVALDEAYLALEAIVGGKPVETQKILAYLDEPVASGDQAPVPWRPIFAAMLAGELRLDAAVPRLVALLESDSDWPGDEAMQALAKIGSDAVVDAIAKRYLDSSLNFRLYAASLFERLHSPQAVERCLELLAREESSELRCYLAQAAVASLSPAAIDPARALLNTEPMTADWLQLRTDVMTVAKLLEMDLPEREAWLAEAQQDAEFSSQFYNPEFPVIDSTGGDMLTSAVPRKAESRLPKRLFRPKRVGRNEPCPCGSGQKFKKCCWTKFR